MLQPQPFMRIDGSELVERFNVAILLRRQPVNIDDIAEARSLLFACVLHRTANYDAFAHIFGVYGSLRF